MNGMEGKCISLPWELDNAGHVAQPAAIAERWKCGGNAVEMAMMSKANNHSVKASPVVWEQVDGGQQTQRPTSVHVQRGSCTHARHCQSTEVWLFRTSCM